MARAALSRMGGMSGTRSSPENTAEFLSGVFPSLDSGEIDELQRISVHVHYDEDELIAQEGSYALRSGATPMRRQLALGAGSVRCHPRQGRRGSRNGEPPWPFSLGGLLSYHPLRNSGREDEGGCNGPGAVREAKRLR